MDIFDIDGGKLAPLADRLRPGTLDEFLGQEHIVGKNSLLRRAIQADRLGSCIFYGVPGVGKTTLAHIIAMTTKSNYAYLNAVSSGVADAKKIIEEAKYNLKAFRKRTYLLLDECHRWNKAQSDCMLSAIEKGEIIFIGSTTENPYVNMTRAIVSRCRVFEFLPLSSEDIKKGIFRAIESPLGLADYALTIEDDALNHLVFVSKGDLRVALNALELAAMTTPPESDGKIIITREIIEQSTQRKSLSINQDNYYDMLSAFCKSLRGSDENAALYYAFRLINAGIEPLIIARRLIAHSAEDVGMADPYALNIALNALTAIEKLGMPEGKIPLTEAIIYVCRAPKSNSVVTALYAAEKVALEAHDEVPMHLRDTSYMPNKNVGYLYPHDFGGYVEQQYLPDDIKNAIFYVPSKNGREKEIKKLKKGD